MANQSTPFTYLVGWSSHSLFYYGVRYADGCHPNNLWNTYFTSSDYVKSTRQKLGEPDVIQVRKVFSSKKEASQWEVRVLRRLKIHENNKFLNKQVNGNWIMDEQTRSKISFTMKGMKRSIEVRIKMSNAKRGKIFTEEAKRNMSLGRSGIAVQNERKELLRQKSLKYWEGVRNGTIQRKTGIK